MDPLHLYVVCIVCGGRESHRGVFLKRALGPPILRKYGYRSRFRFRKCASSSPWRGGGMSLSSEIVRCDLHRYTKKRASVSAVAHDAGRKPSENARRFCFVPAPTAPFCANRGRSPEFATRIFGNADTVGARWRGVSDRQLKFPENGRGITAAP